MSSKDKIDVSTITDSGEESHVTKRADMSVSSTFLYYLIFSFLSALYIKYLLTISSVMFIGISQKN